MSIFNERVSPNEHAPLKMQKQCSFSLRISEQTFAKLVSLIAHLPPRRRIAPVSKALILSVLHQLISQLAEQLWAVYLKRFSGLYHSNSQIWRVSAPRTISYIDGGATEPNFLGLRTVIVCMTSHLNVSEHVDNDGAVRSTTGAWIPLDFCRRYGILTAANTRRTRFNSLCMASKTLESI